MFKNKNGDIRSGWIILIAFILMFVAQGLFSIPGSLVLAEWTNQGGSVPSDGILDLHPWVLLLAQGGGTAGGIIATLLIWRFINKRALSKLGFSGPVKDLVFGLLLGAVSISVIFLILYVSGNVVLLHAFSDPQITVFTFSFFIMFLLVGIFEELFFRGYVMSTMASRGNKKWVTYVVSALLFSIVHGANPNVSIFGLINIVLVGLLFAYMFDTTKSLLLPIGYHITWNYFQGNVFGFAVSGTTPYGIYEVDISEGSAILTGGSFGLEGGILATAMIIIGFIATKAYSRNRTHGVYRGIS